MGACSFQNHVKGATAKEAFQTARENAGYESGFGGYSGTIVEKSDFEMITVPAGKTADDVIREMADSEQDFDFNPYDDKWGPAGCIDLGNGEFVFFGMASS